MMGRAKMSHIDHNETVHHHSGWLIPASFLSAVLLLSGLFLGWYLRPGPRVPAAPTGQSTTVALTIGDRAFNVPANYIQNSAARTGGRQQTVTLAALFPAWQGYSDAQTRLFAGNRPDSPVVRLSLRADANPLDAQSRLSRIYLPYVTDPRGTAAPFDLVEYGFPENSGYAHEDLFAGVTDGRLMLFLCEQPSPQLSSPNCLSTDQPLGGSVSLSFRFKRAWLARWHEMSGGVNVLVARFETRTGN